jgi:hypothetical protein
VNGARLYCPASLLHPPLHPPLQGATFRAHEDAHETVLLLLAEGEQAMVAAQRLRLQKE